MNITIEQAKAILDGIPDYTFAWSCWSANDMLKTATECATPAELVDRICKVEEELTPSLRRKIEAVVFGKFTKG